jgi:hypothetical protein
MPREGLVTTELVPCAPCRRALEIGVAVAAPALGTPWGWFSSRRRHCLLHAQRFRWVEVGARAGFGEVGCCVDEGAVVCGGGVSRVGAFERAFAEAVAQFSVVGWRDAAVLRGLGFEHQLLRHGLVPLEHVAVGLGGKRIAGQPAGECATVDGVRDVEALDCGLEEWDVFFWLEQQLDGLPADETLRCECRDRGCGEGVGLRL